MIHKTYNYQLSLFTSLTDENERLSVKVQGV